MIPAMPLPVAFGLAAVVSPTDPSLCLLSLLACPFQNVSCMCSKASLCLTTHRACLLSFRSRCSIYGHVLSS